jgi:hypothetical protein
MTVPFLALFKKRDHQQPLLFLASTQGVSTKIFSFSFSFQRVYIGAGRLPRTGVLVIHLCRSSVSLIGLALSSFTQRKSRLWLEWRCEGSWFYFCVRFSTVLAGKGFLVLFDLVLLGATIVLCVALRIVCLLLLCLMADELLEIPRLRLT